MTMTCKRCRREFPPPLISPICINGDYQSVCSICALEIVNAIHGTNRTDFGPGSMAQKMLVAAREYVRGGQS